MLTVGLHWRVKDQVRGAINRGGSMLTVGLHWRVKDQVRGLLIEVVAC
jgi:hypothetical protein